MLLRWLLDVVARAFAPVLLPRFPFSPLLVAGAAATLVGAAALPGTKNREGFLCTGTDEDADDDDDDDADDGLGDGRGCGTMVPRSHRYEWYAAGERLSISSCVETRCKNGAREIVRATSRATTAIAPMRISRK